MPTAAEAELAPSSVRSRRGRVIVARLIPAKPSGKRRLGIDVGRLEVPEDFDAPLDEATLASFES